MAEINIVKAFLRTGELLASGNTQRASETTRVIMVNLEKTKGQKEVCRTMNLSRKDKKAFAY